MAKSNGKYLFSVKAMSKVFRGRFIDALKEQLPEEMSVQMLNRLHKHRWVVYAKRPFAGPQSVIEYLGRYTHKIAISNHRIKNISEHEVTFSYKDYRHGSVKKDMSLTSREFIRRYSMHILPKGFVRIRYYGILSSTAKKGASVCIKQQLPEVALKAATGPAPQGYDPKTCPCCKKQTMHALLHYNHRGPPEAYITIAADLLYALI
jgi:hypothetical protein